MFDCMKVAIIGAGLIGSKRADAVVLDSNLIYICDVDTRKGGDLAKKHSSTFVKDYRKVLSQDSVDVVIVATTNKYLAQISVESLNAGKHVLCEKPLGRDLSESYKIEHSAKSANNSERHFQRTPGKECHANSAFRRLACSHHLFVRCFCLWHFGDTL